MENCFESITGHATTDVEAKPKFSGITFAPKEVDLNPSNRLFIHSFIPQNFIKHFLGNGSTKT